MVSVRRLRTAWCLFALAWAASGCQVIQVGHWGGIHGGKSLPRRLPPAVAVDTPRELSKTFLPPYVIEPPDILVVSALHAVPKAPYRLRPFDVLIIQVRRTLPDAPIVGPYTIEPGGFINLGLPYGRLQVVGMSVSEATAAIREHLLKSLSDPEVSVTLAEVAATQQIEGEHLVRGDGFITLGTYGSVKVGGMTIELAKFSIEAHLGEFLENPQVAVDVFAYNSKAYYVILQGAGLGDSVVKFPATGNETVLDAIAQVEGLDSVSSKRMWIARPAPSGLGCPQILPVDWNAITQAGITETNFQVLPGDRIYIAEDKMVAFDTLVGKLISPFERLLGFTTLGTQTVSGIRFFTERGSRGFF